MSAPAALPRHSSDNAAKLKTNNALTTDFFFDTAAANFGNNDGTPSKDTGAQKNQRLPHSSLLATPLNRSSGGQVKKNPSPSILESKYFSRPTAPTPFATQRTPVPLSAGKGAAISPSYSTPLSKKFAAAAPAAVGTIRTCKPIMTPPSSSLISASSDIKARLRQLAATTPSTTTGASPRFYSCSTPPATAPKSTSFISAARDFRIPAASGTTTYSAKSLGAHSRANQMQSELQLRDLEIHKLAAAASEARKERDAQKLRADKLDAIATMKNSPCEARMSSPYAATYKNSIRTASFYQNQSPEKQAQQASSTPSRSNAPSTTTTTSHVPSDAQASVSEFRKEAETLRQQVEMTASELQGQRARADAAEERARYAEARAGAESSASEANESKLRSLQQKAVSMQNEVRRLATNLAIAEDRAGLAEASLAEERNRSRGGDGTGSNSASKGTSNTSALTEVALTAQVRALATQLKVAKTEAATAQQELTAFKAETQGEAAVHEGATASILSANRDLEAALTEASHNIETRGEELEQSRGAVARLAAENAALHAALKDRDEHYAALECRSSNDNAQGVESNARATAAESQLAAAQQELKAAKTRIADLEHAMSKSSGGLNSNSSTGPSPLRDIVGSLRTELDDRELRLAAAEEELATERRRAADLHRQVLDQAVEIDDLQRETHQGGDVFKKELEQARREAHAAAQELAELRHQQQDAQAVGGAAAGNATEVNIELKALREQLDARESEVMALQGQLHMLISKNNSNGGSMGGGGEVENWLLEI